MAKHVELNYSDLDSVNAKLSMINSNYLDLAYKALRQSTDLGSSIMQAGWSFKGKTQIFETVKEAEKQILKNQGDNEKIISIINQIKSTYEGDAAAAGSSHNTSWFGNSLAHLGIATYAITQPLITIAAVNVWAGKMVVSSISSIKNQGKAHNNTNAKKQVTNGVTPLAAATAQITGRKNDNNPANIMNPIQNITSVTQQTILTEIENAKIKELQNQLSKYANSPYKRNGTSVNGIDCSGLVMQAYKDAGIKTDFVHNAAGIYKQCQPVGSYTTGNVDLSALKVGDLVFYSDGGTDAIGHVGIYVGDGNVMSALNSSQGVATKSINYTYKKNIYVARVAQ